MQTLYLDSTQTWNDSNGNKCYGNRSEGSNTSIVYNTVDKHFSTNIHSFKDRPATLILVVDKQTQKHLLFKQTKIDKDGSGEDIYGWNYECQTPQGTITLLVVND